MADTQSQQRTKRDILQAMMTLLRKKKFDDITIGEICDEAMIHRSTFYRYFQDKVDLANTIIYNLSEELLGTDFRKTVVLTQVTHFISDNIDLIRHLIPESQSKFYDEFRNILENLFNERANNPAYQNDPVVTLIKQSSSQPLMISFLANTIMGFLEEQLLKANIDWPQLESFLISIINKLNAQ